MLRVSFQTFIIEIQLGLIVMGRIFLPTPWWVNLAVLVPILTFYAFRKRRVFLDNRELVTSALFASAFAIVEASVVIYLRAVIGLLLGSTAPEIADLSSSLYRVAQLRSDFPIGLLRIEILREAATILILAFVALLTARELKSCCAIFLWMFAIWDLCYYVVLWLAVGWPSSPTTTDILFLIPTPWISQVWFPLLVSITMVVVILLLTSRRPSKNRTREIHSRQ